MKRLFETENPNPCEFKGMKIGDIICTYNAGFHVLTHIKRRFCTQEYHDSYHRNKPDTDPSRLNVGDEYSPNFTYAKIDPDTGKIGRHGECDSHYCYPGIPSIEEQISRLQKQRNKLSGLDIEVSCEAIRRDGESCPKNNNCRFPICLEAKVK